MSWAGPKIANTQGIAPHHRIFIMIPKGVFMSFRFYSRALALTAVALAATACNDHNNGPGTTTINPVATGDTIGYTSAGKVISFDRTIGTTDKPLTSSLQVSGLATGENVVGMDYRPSNSMLYMVSDKGNLYTLNPGTGQVTLVKALVAAAMTPTTTCTPAVTAFTALSGTEFGVDVNPVVDRLRVVSDTGQNLRINMDTGEVITDCKISMSGGTPAPTAVAYTNTVAGTTATATALYYVDANTDMLYTVDTTNSGTANTGVVKAVGPLGVDVGAVNGFDIDGKNNNKAYAGFTVGGVVGFYTIDLTSGAATQLAKFSDPNGIRGLALKP
jgi:hypothetical protein